MRAGSDAYGRNVLEALIGATERALRAAKIGHDHHLREALTEREPLIAELWGLDPRHHLPAFDQRPQGRGALLKNLPGDRVRHLKQVDGELQQVLSTTRKRWRDRYGDLNKGERYLKNMEAQATGGMHNRRLDCTG